MNAIATEKLHRSSNRLKIVMQQLSMANDKIDEDIEEPYNKVIKGYTDPEIANGYVKTKLGRPRWQQ